MFEPINNNRFGDAIGVMILGTVLISNAAVPMLLDPTWAFFGVTADLVGVALALAGHALPFLRIQVRKAFVRLWLAARHSSTRTRSAV